MDLEKSIEESHQFSFLDTRMQTEIQSCCWEHTEVQQFADKVLMHAAVVACLSFSGQTCWCVIITSHCIFSSQLDCSAQKALGKGRP